MTSASDFRFRGRCANTILASAPAERRLLRPGRLFGRNSDNDGLNDRKSRLSDIVGARPLARHYQKHV